MENINDVQQPLIYTQSIPQSIPQIISQTTQVNSSNYSFISKIFTNKYILLIIFIIIGGIIYYFKKIRKKQLSPTPTITNKKEEYVISDLNGNVIKVSGEYVGEYKKPVSIKNSIPQKELDISSDENNNTKQFDLTNSEMKEIASKLKS
jgi:hypothetical protein